MRDLGTFGGPESDSYYINNLGQVVGWARYEGHWRGFLLTPENNKP